MGIKIDILTYLQPLTNDMEVVEVNGGTVGECLNNLVKRFPDIEKLLLAKNGKLLGYLNVYVNGEDAYPEELAKLVRDGDELHIAEIISGG